MKAGDNFLQNIISDLRGQENKGVRMSGTFCPCQTELWDSVLLPASPRPTKKIKVPDFLTPLFPLRNGSSKNPHLSPQAIAEPISLYFQIITNLEI